MKKRHLFAAAAMALSGHPLAASEQAGFLPWRDAEAVAQGQRIYGEYCAACHGAKLEGQPDWQVRGDDGYLPAPPHDPSGHTWHHPDQQLFDITKYGIEAMVGGGYRSRMSGYGDILTDAEIAATLAYIKSKWPDRVIEIHDQINERAAAN
jgi:mono/diheme cytochrome c family protein